MKRFVLIMLALSCVVAFVSGAVELSAFAQTRPDFSGTWVLDREKSRFGPFADSPVAREEVTLTVVHRDPELRITRRSRAEGGREETRELLFFTDGRGELNPATLGRVGTSTKTNWEGSKVVARAKLERRAAGGKTVTFEVSEKWGLSNDGRTLTHTTTAGSPSGVQTVRLVYRRAPEAADKARDR
jgi:hypothetical protein